MLPLQMGTRLYQLLGFKSDNWYEVKISYPASKGNFDLSLNQNRRLLNTEKLIFKTDSLDVLNVCDEICGCSLVCFMR
ncbi:hypothetical protein Pint_25797 [Pistacia integerrima]|uniref:Uncharacterized protein n=1 Tax=Pistacia integerrima TaxID=434235 RepID=A0ACC0YEJ6_9ROSI|nr:hypothetical protein Pint_25797 [Pistacia integerrima]